MKKIALVIVALLIAAPAMADVTIRAATDGEAPGVFRLEYEATGDDASGAYSLISGMAINVSITAGTMDIVSNSYKKDGESTNASPGYGIYPGSIQFDVDKQVTSYGDPPAPSGDPGSLGDLPGNACTVECGALYDDDAIPSDQPLAIGVICKFEVSEACCVTLAVEEVHRKGIVMEDGSAPSNTVLVETCVVIGPVFPACWKDALGLTQCDGDFSGDGVGFNVTSTDFILLKAAYLSTYGDPDPQANPYDPCADANRDGYVTSTDFIALKTYYLQTPPGTCNNDGSETWPPF